MELVTTMAPSGIQRFSNVGAAYGGRCTQYTTGIWQLTDSNELSPTAVNAAPIVALT